MDAARYFEEMHLAMSSQKPEYRLVLSVKVQDLGGADAYLELRQEPVSTPSRASHSPPVISQRSSIGPVGKSSANSNSPGSISICKNESIFLT